ncbi:MAG: hypothetical protein AAGH60_00845 [Pseudomonadota bacterium]
MTDAPQKSVKGRFVAAVAISFLLVACTRTGDFGRPDRGIVGDKILPASGFVSTWSAGEPVSHFSLTDDEVTLRNLGWTLVVPAHAQDWLGFTKAELQRTQIVRRLDLLARPDRYWDFLSSTQYRSSETRYARLADDAAKDLAAIDPYFAQAQRVRLADRQRLGAALGLPDISPTELAAVHGRIAENQRQFAWVKRALLFRLYAYRYAVDRLAITTPSASQGDVTELLNLLEASIEEALEVDRRFAADPAGKFMGADTPVDLMVGISKA